MATATKAMKGFKVTCPECGDHEATVSLDLNDLRVCHCSSCDGEFSPADAVVKAADQFRRWQAVAKWVEMAAELAGE